MHADPLRMLNRLARYRGREISLRTFLRANAGTYLFILAWSGLSCLLLGWWLGEVGVVTMLAFSAGVLLRDLAYLRLLAKIWPQLETAIDWSTLERRSEQDAGPTTGQSAAATGSGPADER
jgi:hypothetical protein